MTVVENNSLSWQDMRRAVGRLAKIERTYMGIPMPIEEAALVMTKSHPHYKNLNGRTTTNLGEDLKDDSGLELVNSWFDRRDRRRIYLLRENGGRVERGWINQGPAHRLTSMLKCLGASLTMDIKAEERAMETLSTLIKPHLFDAYRMLGYFIETSKRSGVTYLFRLLGATIAFRSTEDSTRFLAALCLHPLGYYDDLPMGVMVPTDDVIAHLVMMRSDEVMFWRKSNQHGPVSPGAML